MDPALRRVVLHDNPWLRNAESLAGWLRRRVPKGYLARRISKRQRERWNTASLAHLVIGPRQAGKSTMLWAHLAERGAEVLYLDCEQALVRAWCGSAPLFLDDLADIVSVPTLLFFDEVQHLDDAGLFIKGLVDRQVGAPIWVTGSSSYHLGARTRESLAGRATRTTLLPFSLVELCQDLAGRPAMVRAQLAAERFERHVIFGGYPKAWLAQDPAPVLAELTEAIILRDASDLFRIERPEAFRRLLYLLAGQVGSLVNLAEWAALLGISRDTVAAYLSILEDSHVIASIRPYVGGKRRELTSRPKIYLVDSGIRSHLANDFRPLGERIDAGAMLEGWVFSELKKALPTTASLHFWRSTSGAEVDFVVVDGRRLLAVEVKAQKLKRPRLDRSTRSFIDAYQPARVLIINRSLDHELQLGDTTVRWMVASDWGLDPWDQLATMP